MERVRILNGRFDPLTLTETVDCIFQDLGSGKRGWLATVNVSILMMMRSDPSLQKFVERANLVVADGQPLVWCAPWLDKKLPERVTGVDLVDALCARAAIEGKRIFLLGATQEVVEQLTERLREKHRGLHIEYCDGYFNKDEAASRADMVRATHADILFVGMGVPRQEHFIEEQWSRLGVGMAIGVGGSFDVLAGLRKRAPSWMQAMGLEWLFRLIQEPRRLFMRYLITNCLFVLLILKELISTTRRAK